MQFVDRSSLPACALRERIGQRWRAAFVKVADTNTAEPPKAA